MITRYEDAVAALAAASNWHKSSYSTENACVEVGSTALAAASNWHKSSYSQAANGCVEVGSVRSVVGVRDSKLGLRGPVLAFTSRAWATFVAGVTSR